MEEALCLTTGHDDSQASTQVQNTQWDQQDVLHPIAKLVPTGINQSIVEIHEGVSYTFGRSKECYVQLNSFHVSKVHCCIWYDSQDRAVKIWDNSSNGTYINNKKIGKGLTNILTHGDCVNISKATFVVDEDLEQLVKAGYDIKEFIEKGGYSMVYKGVKLSDGSICAIKVINKSKIQSNTKLDDENKKKLLREIEIVKNISHPNIIRFIDYVECFNSHCIVMEYADGGELFKVLKKNGPISEHVAKIFFKQMVSAVEYLHHNSIAHRDLKPENILLNETTLKLADFGFARFTSDSHTMKTFCGTPNYVAPEILKLIANRQQDTRTGYTTAVDIWSLGIILFIMLTASYPFEHYSFEEPPFTLPSNFEYSYPDCLIISNQVKDLISKLLAFDPDARPSSREILLHPWLQ